jgi:hypothetical protein
MGRPTFLVAEPMPHEGISARKLVLEAARYNVITGYDGSDALELLHRFPRIDGLIVHAGIGDREYERVIDEAAEHYPSCMIILLSPGLTSRHALAKFHLSSHDPKQLLELLHQHFGSPS